MELGRRVVQRMIRLQLSSAFSCLRAAVSRCQQHRHTVERAIGRWRAPAVSDCFSRWVDAISDARARCSVLQRVVTRMQNRLLTVAFERFASCVISAQKKRDMCGQFADAVSTSGTKYANRKCYFAVWSCHVESLRQANLIILKLFIKYWRSYTLDLALLCGRLARRVALRRTDRILCVYFAAWALLHLRTKAGYEQLLGQVAFSSRSPSRSQGKAAKQAQANSSIICQYTFSVWRSRVDKHAMSKMEVRRPPPDSPQELCTACDRPQMFAV